MSTIAMRRPASVVAVAWGLALAQCSGGPASPSIQLNEEFEVAPGDTARIENTTHGIRFVGVISDSRCPTDVVCIQAGDAIVRIQILPSAGGESFDLHTSDGRPVTDGRLTVSLVRLVPLPVSTRTIAPEEYRVTLRASR